MDFDKIDLDGAFSISLNKIEDDRGYFARAWCRKEFEAVGLTSDFVQSNIAYCREKHTLRGMHYQQPPFEEAKLIRCIQGAIFDVMIDLREDSRTFMQWHGQELTKEKGDMLYIPEGFAHGYLSLTDNAGVLYQVTQYYSPEHENGVLWDDKAFGVEWPVIKNLIISEKDMAWPEFSPIKNEL